jgi:hypothetical protein
MKTVKPAAFAEQIKSDAGYHTVLPNQLRGICCTTLHYLKNQ